MLAFTVNPGRYTYVPDGIDFKIGCASAALLAAVAVIVFLASPGARSMWNDEDRFGVFAVSFALLFAGVLFGAALSAPFADTARDNARRASELNWDGHAKTWLADEYSIYVDDIAIDSLRRGHTVVVTVGGTPKPVHFLNTGSGDIAVATTGETVLEPTR